MSLLKPSYAQTAQKAISYLSNTSNGVYRTESDDSALYEIPNLAESQYEGAMVESQEAMDPVPYWVLPKIQGTPRRELH